jgi:hypothetical protein
MKINLHIERLILDGLPVAGSQGPLVQAAVEAELVRLLGVNGLSHELQVGGAVPEVAAGPFRLATETTPSKLGRQIAQAVYGGIGKV